MKKTLFKNNFKKAILRNSTTRLKKHLWLQFVKVLVWLYDIPATHRTHFFVLLSRIQSLRRNSGDTWTVGYLKEAHRLSSHWLSGNPDSQSSGSIRVSVRGLPLIIPGALRNALYARSNLNYLRAVMTLLSVFRVMNAKLNLKISTITAPFNGTSALLPRDEVLLATLKLLQRKPFELQETETTPWKVNRLLNITKAGPNGPVSMRNSVIDAYALFKNQHIYQQLLILADVMAPYLAKLLRNEVTTIKAVLDYPEEKWERIKPFMADKFNELRELEKLSKTLIPEAFSKIVKLGKLSTKIEAAGKVRVFAMVDLWTQSILNPLHEKIFEVLRRLPTDGTFNQLAPLDRFKDLPHGDRFSFDLSAATDRLPIDLQVQILTILHSEKFALAWAGTLVDREYHLKYGKDDYTLKYSVGQPMGALSSWGMLALTHHVIVQVAAQRCYIKGLFQDYALLGDDICIAHKGVADEYLSIMRGLGVEINLSKSLVSSTGVVEFAKRWRIGDTDVSPSSPSLITRLLDNFNYLPVLILDLVGRGVSTIRDPGILQFRPSSFKKMKESLKFSLIPYFDVGYVKCLLPQDGESKSFSQKDIFALYELTDRVFNRLSLSAFNKTMDVDQRNYKSSVDSLKSINDNSKVVIPSIRSLVDNQMIALQFKSITATAVRSWRRDYPTPEIWKEKRDEVLTIERWHAYLLESLSELKMLSTVVPDYNIVKDKEDVIQDKLDAKKIHIFMQELVKDLVKWYPGIFKITPEPIPTEGED